MESVRVLFHENKTKAKQNQTPKRHHNACNSEIKHHGTYNSEEPVLAELPYDILAQK